MEIEAEEAKDIAGAGEEELERESEPGERGEERTAEAEQGEDGLGKRDGE